jgi:surfeit locus 1 family protein
VVALLLPLLVSLGFWQLSRGAEKTALLASYAERRAAEPMASSELLNSADPAYRRVRLHGQFDGCSQPAARQSSA